MVEAALFIDEKSTTCVSTREHPELRAGRVYFTYEKICRENKSLRWDLGVYNLRDGTVVTVGEQGQHRWSPSPAWFIPSMS
ncbi:hypothetical protein ACP70R_032599 [Stipagrostis hirtigluma subsp. patula]